MASQIRHDLSLLVFFLITGLLLLLYPTVSDYWNSHYQSEA
ncbi:TPA: class C sortase, partial [Streptococcus suis]